MAQGQASEGIKVSVGALVGDGALRLEARLEAVDAELKLVKSQQVRAMAKLSVQKSKAEKQLASIRTQLKKIDEDKSALFREVSSLEAQLAQAQADASESRNWASTYRDMLLKVT